MTIARPPVAVHDARVAATLMLAAAALRPLLPPGAGLPCPLRLFTGIPCPLCGMTTSVTATVHGHLGAALAANPAGIAVVLIAIGLLVRRDLQTVRMPVVLAPLVLGALWLFELARFSIF